MAKMPDVTVKVDVIEVSALHQLAEECRRLAAEADKRAKEAAIEGAYVTANLDRGRYYGLLEAAQILEEKLNG